MNISDLSFLEDVNCSDNLEVNSVIGGNCNYNFTRRYEPEILERICADEELLKEMFPGEKTTFKPDPFKTKGIKPVRVYSP